MFKRILPPLPNSLVFCRTVLFCVPTPCGKYFSISSKAGVKFWFCFFQMESHLCQPHVFIFLKLNLGCAGSLLRRTASWLLHASVLQLWEWGLLCMAAVRRPLTVVASLVQNGCWGFGSCLLVGSVVVAHWAQLPRGMRNLSSWTRIRTCVPCIVGQILKLLDHQGSPSLIY